MNQATAAERTGEDTDCAKQRCLSASAISHSCSERLLSLCFTREYKELISSSKSTAVAEKVQV